MRIVDWLRSLLHKQEHVEPDARLLEEKKPPGLERTVFVRCMDSDKVVEAIVTYSEMVHHELQMNDCDLRVYASDQGWTPVSVAAQLPTYHFLNLVSWFTDLVEGDDKEAAFGGSVGWSHAAGAEPKWNLACQTDPREDGSVIVGVLENGKWFTFDLSTFDYNDATPLFDVGKSMPLQGFLRKREIPARLWGDPGYSTYLPQIARVRMG